MANEKGHQGKPGEDRERVTGRQSGFDERPRTTNSQPAKPPAQRSTNTGMQALPQTRGTGTQAPLGATTAGRELTAHQKSQLSSAFQDAATANKLSAMLGKTVESKGDGAAEGDSSQVPVFDGRQAAPELANKDVWKAVQPPVQSHPGRRSLALLQNVINQFAVGTNPRYVPDAVDKPRGHIFVWDISRAMNCEVPHFVGPRELTIGQTVDWIRHEGPMRGWTRADANEAVEAAKHGQLAIALPCDIKMKHLAIVLPLPADPGLKPRVASASRKIGDNLPLAEGIGAHAAEYFVHQ